MIRIEDFFIALLALAASAVLTPLARRLALRMGVLDHPHPRKLHASPTPLLGGLAIFFGVWVAILFLAGDSAGRGPAVWLQLFGLLCGGAAMVFGGIVDDRGRLHSLAKLWVVMPAAGIILAWGGIRIGGWPLGYLADHPLAYSLAGVALTVIWVVVITSSISILDNMDGLCAGVAAIASAFFLLFAGFEGQRLVSVLAASLLGASIGFLVWNYHPARIFMGSAGAMFTGYMLSALAIKLRFLELPTVHSWMIPVLILGVPLFDTALVTISRVRRGLNPLISPGKDHVSHRLLSLGLSPRAAASVLYGMGTVCGLLALLVHRLPLGQAAALMSGAGLAAILGIVLLERAPYQRQERLEGADRSSGGAGA